MSLTGHDFYRDEKIWSEAFHSHSTHEDKYQDSRIKIDISKDSTSTVVNCNTKTFNLNSKP